MREDAAASGETELRWGAGPWAVAVLAWPFIGLLVTAARQVGPLAPETTSVLSFVWAWLPWAVWVFLVPMIIGLARRVGPGTPLRVRFAGHAAGVIAIAILHVLLVLGLAPLFPEGVTGAPPHPLRTLIVVTVAFAFLSNVMIYAATAIAATAWESSRRSRRRRLVASRLEREIAEAELRLIESSIHLPLLMETLGSIERALQGGRSSLAEELIESFARFLRLALRRMKGEERDGEALELIESLLELQRLRHEARFAIERRGGGELPGGTSFDLQRLLEALAAERFLWGALERIRIEIIAHFPAPRLLLELEAEEEHSSAVLNAVRSLTQACGGSLSSADRVWRLELHALSDSDERSGVSRGRTHWMPAMRGADA